MNINDMFAKLRDEDMIQSGIVDIKKWVRKTTNRP